ncbi:MAG: hypothetical protein ABWY51_04375 [Gaiellaceae bacterium]
MKWLVVGIAVVAVAAAGTFAGLYFTKNSESRPVTVQPCGNERIFGHIRSLVRRGDHYVLRFDPAWFALGETANTAAAEDGAVDPGEPVPNDVYVIDESHRLLTYLVRPGAHVTVLVNNGTGILSTPITVAELGDIVQTGESSRRKLFESLESGVWIRYRIDTACALDQQYRP